MTAGEFEKLCASVLVTREQSAALYKKLAKKLEWKVDEADRTHEFIASYVDRYRERYQGSTPIIKGRPAGSAKRIVAAVGADLAIELARTFLGMDDYKAVQARHDLPTMEYMLQAVKTKYDTGLSVTHTQAKRAEQGGANTDAMKRFLARRRDDC